MASVCKSFAALKVGALALVKTDHVIRIADVAKSAPGKHGAAKKAVTGRCIFSDKTISCVFHPHTRFEHFTIERAVYTLVNVSADGFLVLMDDAGALREDIACPDDTAKDAELGRFMRALLARESMAEVHIVTAVVGTGGNDDSTCKVFTRITAVNELALDDDDRM